VDRVDGITGVLQFAVDGLSTQQQVIADNLANTETPGFTAQQVNFQSSLEQALNSPDGGTAQVSVTDSSAPAGTNGNNVSTGQQLVDATQTMDQYQTMVDLLNAQYRLVQGVSGGSFT
jgi:flagellar basal-body rod protein FlgB